MVWERGEILHSASGLGYLSREERALEGERIFFFSQKIAEEECSI